MQNKRVREIEGLAGLDNVSRLKKMLFYSKEICLLRMDLIQIWKTLHSDINVGLSYIVE